MIQHQFKHIMCACSILAISGCAYHQYSPPEPQAHPLVKWQTSEYRYQPLQTHKLLSDYTEKLAMDLVENMGVVNTDQLVGVSSFSINSDNQEANAMVTSQLTESLVNEMQIHGLTVLDYQATNNADWLLGGTVTYNAQGAIVNARMVERRSKVVISSAKTFIPGFMLK